MKATATPQGSQSILVVVQKACVGKFSFISLIINAIYLWTGSRLESGPTTPLPDKKLLLFILDRLQKCVFLAACFSFPFLFLCFLIWDLNFDLFFHSLCRKDTHGVFLEPVDPEEVLLLCNVSFISG